MLRFPKKRPKEGLFQTIKRSITYTNLLDSIMPSSSKHNAAKVAQTLGTPMPENGALSWTLNALYGTHTSTVPSLPVSSTTGTLSDVWTGPEPEPEEADNDTFDSTCRDDYAPVFCLGHTSDK